MKRLADGLPLIQSTVECRQWHRACNAKYQADAAVNTACADFRHTRNGADRMSRCWTNAAEASNTSPGARAYAYQQAAMYAAMRDECQVVYDRTRRAGSKGEELDHSTVSALLRLT